MALSGTERWDKGFVVSTTTNPPALVMTTSLVNAQFSQGFLRDPDGRLVVKVI